MKAMRKLLRHTVLTKVHFIRTALHFQARDESTYNEGCIYKENLENRLQKKAHIAKNTIPFVST